jgi:hypothetical protein
VRNHQRRRSKTVGERLICLSRGGSTSSAQFHSPARRKLFGSHHPTGGTLVQRCSHTAREGDARLVVKSLAPGRPLRWMSRKDGERAYRCRLRNHRNLGESGHSSASQKLSVRPIGDIEQRSGPAFPRTSSRRLFMHGPFNCGDCTGKSILGAHGGADRMGALAHRVVGERRLDRGCERVRCQDAVRRRGEAARVEQASPREATSDERRDDGGLPGGRSTPLAARRARCALKTRPSTPGAAFPLPTVQGARRVDCM